MLTTAQSQWLKRVFDLGAPAVVVQGDEPDGAEAPKAKERFRQRLAQLHDVLQELDEGIAQRRFRGAGADVLAAVKRYNKARADVAKAQTDRRWRSGNEALDRLDTAVNQLATGAGARRERDAAERENYDQRKQYLTGYAALDEQINQIIQKGRERKFTGPLEAPWQTFSDANDRRADAARARRYGDALAQLDRQRNTIAQLDPPPGPLDRARVRRDALEDSGARLVAGINGGAYKGVDPESAQFKIDFSRQLGLATQAIDGADAALAQGRLDTLATTIDTFRGVIAGHLRDTAGTDKGKALKQAKASLQQDPNALRVLMAQAGGAQALDAMMKSVGSSAKSDADQAFVKAAILARYDMSSLAGDMTTKALPRLYAVLGQVPQAHTTLNPKLQHIRRNRGSEQPSTYDFTSQTLTLNVGKTGSATEELDQDADVDAAAKLPKTKVNKFTHTTLHELGHSVDDAVKFMQINGGDDKYGGWALHRIDDIADVAGTKKGFFADHVREGVTQDFLRELLKCTLSDREWDALLPEPRDLTITDRIVVAKPGKATLLAHAAVRQAQTDRDLLLQEQGGWDAPLANTLRNELRRSVDPFSENAKVVCAVIDLVYGQRLDTDAAVSQVLAQLVVLPRDAAPVNFNAMKGHAAVAWCTWARKGDKDMWERYRSSPSGFAVDGRVHFLDDNNWRSYKVSARRKGVSQYQFKAPAEWFAELYAAFHTNKLPPTHPDAGWLAEKFGHVAG